jgi:hypothetical protein
MWCVSSISPLRAHSSVCSMTGSRRRSYHARTGHGRDRPDIADQPADRSGLRAVIGTARDDPGAFNDVGQGGCQLHRHKSPGRDAGDRALTDFGIVSAQRRSSACAADGIKAVAGCARFNPKRNFAAIIWSSLFCAVVELTQLQPTRQRPSRRLACGDGYRRSGTR